MRLQLSPRAALDLEEIGDFIAQDNPERALTFIDELYDRCVKVSELPLAYRQRDDIAECIRLCVHGNYLILFRIEDDCVRVERIVHSARRLQDLL